MRFHDYINETAEVCTKMMYLNIMLSLHERNFLLKKEVQVKIINARAATALSTMEQLLLHIYSPAADFFAAGCLLMKGFLSL